MARDQESYKWILPISFSKFRSSCKCSDHVDGIGTFVASQIGPFQLSKFTQVCYKSHGYWNSIHSNAQKKSCQFGKQIRLGFLIASQNQMSKPL
jgi:hypothetical protein